MKKTKIGLHFLINPKTFLLSEGFGKKESVSSQTLIRDWWISFLSGHGQDDDDDDVDDDDDDDDDQEMIRAVCLCVT